MSVPNEVKIDLAEGFSHLPQAPIVEAVIEIQTLGAGQWEENSVRIQLETKLPEYAFLDSQREFKYELKLRAEQPSEQNLQDLGWKGLRFRSKDQHYIAQFNRTGFVLSRLQPYETWEKLFQEAMRLWGFYLEVSDATELRRLGVRFINRIGLPGHEVKFEDYIQPAPEPPKKLNLPFHMFIHHDTLAVPGYPYAINVVRTIQPPNDPGSEGVALLLDIDVFTLPGVELQMDALEECLAEMRWLKNKVFFGSITTKALENFK